MYRTELIVLCIATVSFTILYMSIFITTMFYLYFQKRKILRDVPLFPHIQNDEKQKPQCRNESLNKMHKYGNEQLRSSKTMCVNKDATLRDTYYKKFRPVQTYEQLVTVPTPNDGSYEMNAEFTQ